MQVKDASAVAIAAINQLYGAEVLPVGDGSDPVQQAITELDTQTVVDAGKVVTSSNTIASNFIANLVDMCGRIVIENRAYIPELPSLFVDPIDWGGFIEHVKIGLADIITDEMYNSNGFVNYTDLVGNGTYTGSQYAQHIAEIEHGFYQPRINSKLFDEASAVMVPLSTYRDQLRTAFKDVGDLTRFIAGLYQSVENTLKARAEVYALMLVQTAIAVTADTFVSSSGNRDHVVHLLTEWVALGGTDYTSNQAGALKDSAFMAYALERISEVRDEMGRYSTAFNNGKDITFTPKADNQLALISHFTRAAKFGVRANTYNEELLGIGDYDNITSWQAITSTSGTFDLETCSTVKLSEAAAIKFKLGLESSGTYTQWATGDGTYEKQYVIGIAYDRYALGISLEREATTSNYIASNNVWNSFAHAIYNMIINDIYNLVVFALD